MQIKDYLNGITKGDISILGKAITLIESTLETDKQKAEELVAKCAKLGEKSIRLGISGTPGVGKSTFIESLGSLLVEQGKKVAILTIDPSSTLSKGSILGDKTRMPKLTNSKLAFIRPSPSSGILGGISNTTKDAITICEAAKFNVIFIETVGVGQSESIVESISDLFIYLTLTQNGDQLQFIKKGVLELSDIILINKADQDLELAKSTKHILQNSIQHNKQKKEQVVFTSSGLSGLNVKEIWKHILFLHETKYKNGEIQEKRRQQQILWFETIIAEECKQLLSKNIKFKQILSEFKKETLHNPRTVALKIINKILKKL